MNTRQKKLKKEFIDKILELPDSYPDTNAGFRRFLKDKGEPVFNFRKGGLVKKPKIAKRGY